MSEQLIYESRMKKYDNLSKLYESRILKEENKDPKYQAYFRKMLKKFGVSEPDQLKGSKKKEFYNAVDKGWKADNETDVDENTVNELTKKQVFGALNKAMSGNPGWLTIDDITKGMPGFPMSKQGVEAHLRELVRNKKAKESIKKGKAIYKLT